MPVQQGLGRRIIRVRLGLGKKKKSLALSVSENIKPRLCLNPESLKEKKKKNPSPR